MVVAACSSTTTGSGTAKSGSTAVVPSVNATAPEMERTSEGSEQGRREAALTEFAVGAMEQEHVLGKKIDDSVARAAFNMYIDRLDGEKMFLLASDRDALSVHADKIDDQLRSGSLGLARDGLHQ
jgi:carboxyl-terminal processing protease